MTECCGPDAAGTQLDNPTFKGQTHRADCPRAFVRVCVACNRERHAFDLVEPLETPVCKPCYATGLVWAAREAAKAAVQLPVEYRALPPCAPPGTAAQLIAEDRRDQ